MIKKLFVLSVLTTLAVYATNLEKPTEMKVEIKEQSRGWNLDDIKKESGESCETGNCDNGNCPTNLKCFQKDGPMHTFMSIFTDRMKRHCNRD
jgi:lipoate synthase